MKAFKVREIDKENKRYLLEDLSFSDSLNKMFSRIGEANLPFSFTTSRVTFWVKCSQVLRRGEIVKGDLEFSPMLEKENDRPPQLFIK